MYLVHEFIVAKMCQKSLSFLLPCLKFFNVAIVTKLYENLQVALLLSNYNLIFTFTIPISVIFMTGHFQLKF